LTEKIQLINQTSSNEEAVYLPLPAAYPTPAADREGRRRQKLDEVRFPWREPLAFLLTVRRR